jgi:hypothetical protein
VNISVHWIDCKGLAPPLPWRPILSGALRERALETVGALCDAAGSTWVTSEKDSTLLGHSAHALLLHEVSRAGILPIESDALEKDLELARRALAEAELGPSLLAGYPGIAWSLHHIAGEAPQPGDTFDDIDAAMLEQVSSPETPLPCDLDGLAGMGVYALERMPVPSAKAILTQIVRRLQERSLRSNDGAAWKTEMPGVGPQFNLGVAHGIPGILCFLAGAAGCGIGGALGLLEDGVRWLWRWEQPGELSRFPFWIADGQPSALRWPGWCYGDPAVAAAMYAAGRATSSLSLQQRAFRLAAHTLSLTPETLSTLPTASPVGETGAQMNPGGALHSPFLCHGAAGRAHMLNRMYQWTGEERFAVAARSWIEWLFLLAPTERSADWGETGLVYGAAGVGLVLIAALSATEARWDRLLMMSVVGVAGGP